MKGCASGLRELGGLNQVCATMRRPVHCSFRPAEGAAQGLELVRAPEGKSLLVGRPPRDGKEEEAGRAPAPKSEDQAAAKQSPAERSVIDELAERFSCQALNDQPETEGGAQDPLRWFGGALAPHDLRKAQRAFAEALDCMVRAASLSMQIQTLCLAVDNERGD